MTDNTDGHACHVCGDPDFRCHHDEDTHTDGPTGQDRSEPPPGWKCIEPPGWVQHEASGQCTRLHSAWADYDELVEGAGQVVAALRAEVERLRFRIECAEGERDSLRIVVDRGVPALREQLATVTRERQAYGRQLNKRDAELATARERIAALEALADRARNALESMCDDAFAGDGLNKDEVANSVSYLISILDGVAP